MYDGSLPSDNQPSNVAVGNSRTEEQTILMQKAHDERLCPFCNLNWEINTLIKEGTFWFLMLNKWPYPNHEHHLVLVPKRHVTTFTELTAEERLEWFEINQFAVNKFNLDGGALVMRFGELKRTAGTIAHLHSHVQVPDLKGGYAMAVFAMNDPLAIFLGIKK